MQKYCLLLAFGLAQHLAAQPIAVMVDKMNLIYAGIPTEITVVVDDLPNEFLNITPTQGEIAVIDTSQGQYCWTICQMDSSRAWLILKDARTGVCIDTLAFRVKHLPEPNFKKVDFRYEPYQDIIAFYDDGVTYDNWRAEVVSYDLVKITETDILVKHSDATRRDFFYMDPGDIVHCYNIKWRAGCDPTVRKSTQVLEFKQ